MAKRPARPVAQEGFVRETFRHAAIYSGASVLARTISFIMLPFYAHILRNIGYGVIGMIDASLTFLGSLFAYNFRGAITRIYHEEPDPARKPLAVTTGVIIVLALTVPLTGIAMLFSRPLSGLLFGDPGYWHLICLAFGAFVLDTAGQTALVVLVIRRKSLVFSLLSLVRLVIGLGLNILLVVILRWDLTGYFLAGLLTSLLGSAIGIAVAVRECKVGLGFDRKLARDLIAFQLPLVPSSLATFASRQVERILVRYQIDIGTLGVLEMGYKFPVLLNMLIITPFMSSWQTKRTEIAEEPGAPERIGRMFAYFLYLALLGGLIIAADIRVLLQLLTPEEFWGAFRIARVEVVTTVLMGCYGYLQFGLFWAKKTDLIARTRIVTAIGKVGLSYLMISLWGIYGAAYSAMIMNAVLVVWIHILSQRYYHQIIEWHKIALIVGGAALLFVAIDRIETATIAGWLQPLAPAARALVDRLADTWLGTWKDGKVVALLDRSGILVVDLAVRTLLCGLFLLLMPFVHVETQQKLARRFPLPRSR
ncbi:MAG: lipopolysaccharide biosynthesis protein [Candidatus Krumholzibacteriia bacterium]